MGGLSVHKHDLTGPENVNFLCSSTLAETISAYDYILRILNYKEHTNKHGTMEKLLLSSVQVQAVTWNFCSQY